MPKEFRKRFAPTKDTLRELYLKSGNQCAFPGCSALIMDSDGKCVGQICHIEAAEKGGERFNPNQTNEECRSFANLLLMCYEHHVITNDVDTYKVSDMQTIKANHEAKFTNVEGKLDTAFQTQEHQQSATSITLTDSPGSIVTIGQTGNNVIVNPKVDVARPNVVLKDVFDINQDAEYEGQACYLHQVLVDINSRAAINRIALLFKDDSLLAVKPSRTHPSQPCMSEGVRLATLNRPAGTQLITPQNGGYTLKIYCKNALPGDSVVGRFYARWNDDGWKFA